MEQKTSFRFVGHLDSPYKDGEHRTASKKETPHEYYTLVLCEIVESTVVKGLKSADTWTRQPLKSIAVYQGTLEEFKTYHSRLTEALENPVLHLEDLKPDTPVVFLK